MAAHHRTLVVSLPIADRWKSMIFYRDAFGFDPVGTPEEDGVPEPLRFQLDERTLLMLIPADGFDWVLGDRVIAPREVSECLLGLSIDTEREVDALVERVRGAGGEVIAEPAHQPWGYTALCTDLDGHAWQLTVVASELL